MPGNALAMLADALESALFDVRNAIQLGERLDRRSLCSATPSLRFLTGALTEVLLASDAGFLAAIAQTHEADNAC